MAKGRLRAMKTNTEKKKRKYYCLEDAEEL
jgi:hypothetical protein